MNIYREPAVAGLFYPAGYWKLKEEIETHLASAVFDKSFDDIFGIVSPHAGYQYSGRTAAFAFNLIKDKKYKNIFIVSPSHKEYFPGVSVYDGDGYETPLGRVPVNKEIIENITSGNKIIFKGIEGHRGEHGVEVQIPFLQYIYGDSFNIIPIVVGDQSKLFIDQLSVKLAEVVDNESLVIASSDLSHFYNRREADLLDSIIEKRINDFDFNSLQSDLDERRCEACGGGPIVSMMKAASLTGKDHALVIHRSDSGDTTGDLNEVVGYLSAVVYGV